MKIPSRMFALNSSSKPRLSGLSASYMLLMMVSLGSLLLVCHEIAYRKIFRIFFSVASSKVDFFEHSILLEALRSRTVVVAVFVISIPLVLNRRKLHWKYLGGKPLQGFITAACATLAWTYSTYDFNLYLNQPHTNDRLTLVTLVFLVWFRPYFVSLFIPACLLMMAQFNYPFFDYSLTDKYLPYSILILFLVFLHLLTVGRVLWYLRIFHITRLQSVFLALLKSRGNWYLFITLVLIASTYASCGATKIEVGRGWAYPFDWVIHDDLDIGVRQYFARGWLASIDYKAKDGITSIVQNYKAPMIAVAFLIEFTVVVCVISSRWAQIMLLSASILHLGIFAASGIFFWKWIAIDLGFLILIAFSSQARRLFNSYSAIAGILLVGISLAVFRPIQLGWWYLPYQRVFYWNVEGVSGKTYALNDAFLTPYEMHFTFQRYLYLVNAELPTIDSSDFSVKQMFDDLGPEAIEHLPKQNLFEMDKAMKHDQFLRQWIENLERRGTRKHWMSQFPAPHHIWKQREQGQLEIFSNQEPVQAVKLRLVELFHSDDGTSVLSNRVVRRTIVK